MQWENLEPKLSWKYSNNKSCIWKKHLVFDAMGDSLTKAVVEVFKQEIMYPLVKNKK